MATSDQIVCTMPGRHGDILWALPTCRALAEQSGHPVGLVISGKYGSLVSLLREQSYLAFVHVDYKWQIEETAPPTPRVPPRDEQLGRMIHLGYEGWPHPTLPKDISARAGVRVDLNRPWITFDGWPGSKADVCVGFTDEHFELKLGLYTAIGRRLKWDGPPGSTTSHVLVAPGSRWQKEGKFTAIDWTGAARWMSDCQVFLGCCSALHVLALAMGKRVVMMEPNPQRHQEVFFPFGKQGKVNLVLGGDGQPTFDSRHVGDTVERAIHRYTEQRG